MIILSLLKSIRNPQFVNMPPNSEATREQSVNPTSSLPELKPAQRTILNLIEKVKTSLADTHAARELLRNQIIADAWKKKSNLEGLHALGPLACATHKRQAGLNIVALDEILLKLDGIESSNDEDRQWRKSHVKKVQALLVEAEQLSKRADKLQRLHAILNSKPKKQSPEITTGSAVSIGDAVKASAAMEESEPTEAEESNEMEVDDDDSETVQQPQTRPNKSAKFPAPEYKVDSNPHRVVIWMEHPGSRHAKVLLKSSNVLTVLFPHTEELELELDRPDQYRLDKAVKEVKYSRDGNALLVITIPKRKNPTFGDRSRFQGYPWGYRGFM